MEHSLQAMHHHRDYVTINLVVVPYSKKIYLCVICINLQDPLKNELQHLLAMGDFYTWHNEIKSER